MSTENAPATVPSVPAPGSRHAGKTKFLLISLAVLALDQWTKWMIELHLPEHTSHPVLPGIFHISHVRNTGVAFGMFAGQGATGGMVWLVLVGLVALGVVAVFFWRTPREEVLLLVALSLVLGGAVGNLVDRLASGAVTDFLLVYLGSYHWPDFNIADSAISIGLCLLVLDSFRPSRASRGGAEAAS